ncbi:MAG TPA: ribosome small subunit-dependent GTPase A [Candidatus Dormibacteraeota bacterium]|nr:ribosome small subunit-dependent GTPase A [Candidatus Dormibacteraeota bacterium]
MTEIDRYLPANLEDLGWDPEFAMSFEQLALEGSRPARVTRVDRGLCTVLDPTPARVTYGSHQLTTGDWLAIGPGLDPHDREQVLGVVPRRTAFRRLGSGKDLKAQVVAANVDVVLLANALDRELNLHSLQRYLAVGWDSGAVPVVVLTKSDRLPDLAVLEQLRKVAEVAGAANSLAISVIDGRGISELTQRWIKPGRTAAVVGASGAGKSTLVNLIAGTQRMGTGEVRADGKGRHTTSHRELLVVPGRGILLDTPGMRSLGLWADNEGLAQTFQDLEELGQACRFRDCEHAAEPGCAVRAAIESGAVTLDRLESWRKLERELRALAARQGELDVRSQERERWKSLTRQRRRKP